MLCILESTFLELLSRCEKEKRFSNWIPSSFGFHQFKLHHGRDGTVNTTVRMAYDEPSASDHCEPSTRTIHPCARIMARPSSRGCTFVWVSRLLPAVKRKHR